jgi:hypothetical protein
MKSKIAVEVAVVLFLTAYYLAPYYAVYSMRRAVQARDAAGVSHGVDYPALRESLKANLAAEVAVRLRERPGDPAAALAPLLGAGLADILVDSMASPEGLAALLRGGVPELGAPAAAAGAAADVRMGYGDEDTFVVTVRSDAGKPLELIFRRHGLYSWKLSAVKLPF